MVRDKPLDTLALRRRFRDRLPCTFPTASCDDLSIGHGQKHEPRSPGSTCHPHLEPHPPMTEGVQLSMRSSDADEEKSMSEAVLVAWNFAHRAATEACDRIKDGRPGCGTWDTVAMRVTRDLELRSSCLSEYERSVVREATIWFIEQYRTQHTAHHESNEKPASPEMLLDGKDGASTQLLAPLRRLWAQLTSTTVS